MMHLATGTMHLFGKMGFWHNVFLSEQIYYGKKAFRLKTAFGLQKYKTLKLLHHLLELAVYIIPTLSPP